MELADTETLLSEFAQACDGAGYGRRDGSFSGIGPTDQRGLRGEVVATLPPDRVPYRDWLIASTANGRGSIL